MSTPDRSATAPPAVPVSTSPPPREDRTARDRGSAAIIVVVFALTLLVLAGFVVDGGLAISNKERAQDIAEQAARYAAQDLDEDALRNRPEGASGVAAPINHANCEARVRTFISSINLTSASIVGTPGGRCVRLADNRLAVTITVRYQPLFTSFFSSSFDVSGRAEAEAQTG